LAIAHPLLVVVAPRHLTPPPPSRRGSRQAAAADYNAGVSEHDSKHIIRQWDREIEDELRREAARRHNGPWKAVGWTALWVLWLLLLAALVGHVKSLG
jgi:hypothetical protein